jgi:two-component system, OmpR family, response regulator
LDLRILVIDDNEEITEAIHFFCESMKDIECYMINDGRQGLERIKREKFDLVMLDLAMPEFSGYDVIKPLKEDGVIESNNIVVFTASSDVKTLNKIRNSGVKEVFKKPFSLDDIIALIEKYRPIA